MCDACATTSEARKAWVELLLGQLPSHRANAERTRAFLDEGDDYLERYRQWEGDYEEYLASVCKEVAEEGRAPSQPALIGRHCITECVL